MSHWTKCVKTAVLAAATFAIVGTATPALAQGAQPADKAIDKISFGYKFYRVSQSEADAVNFPLGVYFDVDGKLKNKDLKWIAEVTWAHRSESETDDEVTLDVSESILFVGAGIKKEWADDPKLIKHVQGLVGFARSSFSADFGDNDDFSESNGAFALKVSGAVDKYLTDKWDARFGAGFIHVFSDPGANIIRLFVGVVKKSN